MSPSLLAAALAMTCAVASGTALAAEDTQAEIAQLKAQLAQLQGQLAALESRLGGQAGEVTAPVAAPAAAAATAEAARVETRGGLRVTSADKQFEASIGGRIHFDAYGFDRDLANATGTSEFRRARLILAGKLYGWDYRMEQDFAAGNNLDGLRDLYLARSALGGKFTIGQFKPYRSMEELTSSNDITMMERPFASATGLYSGRQFQQGVGYLRGGGNHTLGLAAFNLRSAGGLRNEGTGAAARLTWSPVHDQQRALHFGLSASHERAGLGTPNVAATAFYSGRRGPFQVIAATQAGAGDTVDTLGLEAAAAFGPLYLQSEVAHARYERSGTGSNDVATWYLMGSWMLNGGQRPYKPATAVFGAPRVADQGLWELTARYDTIENRDIRGLRVNSWILGLNYYINPGMRVMFNYTRGDNEFSGDGTDQYAIRTQLSF